MNSSQGTLWNFFFSSDLHSRAARDLDYPLILRFDCDPAEVSCPSLGLLFN